MLVENLYENQYHEKIISELKREEEKKWENIRHVMQLKNINQREKELERD